MFTNTPIPEIIPVIRPMYALTALFKLLTGASKDIVSQLRHVKIRSTNAQTTRLVACAPCDWPDESFAEADSDIFICFVLKILRDKNLLHEHFDQDETLVIDANVMVIDKKPYHIAFGVRHEQPRLIPILQLIPVHELQERSNYRFAYISMV